MPEFSAAKSAQELLADQMWAMLREIGVDPTFKDSKGFEMDADGVLLEVARIMIERIPVAEEPEVNEQIKTLLRDLTDPDDCWFDHHGGCQAHGYLSLQPGEKCPHAEAKELLASWVPVKQEGASPSGFPVAGLIHAGGDSHAEREDADQPETDAEPVPEGLIYPPGDDEHEQEQGADEQVPVELHTDDSTPAGRHTGMKQEGGAADG